MIEFALTDTRCTRVQCARFVNEILEDVSKGIVDDDSSKEISRRKPSDLEP